MSKSKIMDNGTILILAICINIHSIKGSNPTIICLCFMCMHVEQKSIIFYFLSQCFLEQDSILQFDNYLSWIVYLIKYYFIVAR